MDDLIRAARTRIKKKQEEMLSSADLIEQARIRNAYNGGAAKPDNYIKREKTVTPAGPYTPTIKPVQATATPIKPAPVPTATPIKPAPLPTVNRIKPVSPDSPLFNGYPFVRDYTRTAQNALNNFHEQNKAIEQARLSELEKRESEAIDAGWSAISNGKSFTQNTYSNPIADKLSSGDLAATDLSASTLDENVRIAKENSEKAFEDQLRMNEAAYAANILFPGSELSSDVNAVYNSIDGPHNKAIAARAQVEQAEADRWYARSEKAVKNMPTEDYNAFLKLGQYNSALGVVNTSTPLKTELEKNETEQAEKIIGKTAAERNEARKEFGRLYTELENKGYNVQELMTFYSLAESKRIMEAAKQEARDYAENDPTGASFKSFAYTPGKALSYLDTATNQVARTLSGDYIPLNKYSKMYYPSAISNELRGTVSENIDNPFANFLYNTGMSMGDFLMYAPLGASGAALLAGNAAGDTVYSVLDKGGTPEQALRAGTIAGLAEYAFEKISIDQLSMFKQNGGKELRTYLLNAAKGAGVEASEEVLTEMANMIADYAIMGDKSDYARMKRSLMEMGYSELEADRQAKAELINQIALAAAGGGLSGGILSPAATAYGNIQDSRFERQAGRALDAFSSTDEVSRQINLGIDAPKNSDAYRAAVQAYDQMSKGKAISDKTLADLYSGNVAVYGSDASLYATAGAESVQTADANANQNAGNNMYAAQETQAQGQTEVHTPEQLRIMKEYEEAVDPTIVEFIDRVQAGIASPKAKRTVGQINGNLAKEISNIVGFDVDGFSALLEPSAIKHINKRHGGIGQADQSLADKKDIARIGYVIENYDSVTKGKDDKPHWGHLDRYGNPAKIVEIRKRIDGEYVVFEAVPDTDAKAAYVVSARIEKADEKGQRMADAASSPAPYVRNAYADPNDSISNNSTNVNSQAGTARQVVNQIEQDVRAKQSQVDLRNRVSEEAAAQQFDALNERYGSIKAGENPKTDIAVPKRTSDSKKTRQFVRTILETGQLNNEMVADVKRAVIDEALSYVPISNQMLLTFAENEINRNPDTATSEWEGVAKKGGNLTAREIATGEILLKKAAQEGNAARLLSITQALSRQGTESGRATQAFRIIKNSGPLGMLYSIQQQVDAANRQNTKENGKLRNKKQGLIVLDEQLALDLANATTQEEITTAKDNLMQNVADQMPASWVEKWNQWRHMAMLANPKTHIRNFVGNAAFMPVVKTKEFLNAAIQAGLEKAGVLDRSQRTTTFKASEAAKEEAAADYPKIQKTLQSGGKYNPSNEINDKRTIFQNRVLEAVQKGNGRLLEAADGLFLKHYYTQALARYLTAQKVDLDNISPATLDRARAYAFDEALEATYRDYSAFAAKLQQWSNSSKVADFIISGVLPFKKTPINILKRGVEYSPAGLVDAVSRGTVQLKRGEITPAQYINRISKGLTGTGLAALGIWLSSLGIITGGASGEDDDRLNSVTGKQNYSINIGGRSYTLDWLAPDSIPFFVGVEFQRLCQGQYEDMTTEDILDTFSTMLEPMLNLSMLSSLNDTLNEISYSENKISAILQTIAYSYLLQAFPTLGSSIGRTIDGTQRRTYIDKNSGVPSAVQKFGQQIAGKIPGLTYTKQPYVNAWGQEIEERNIFTRIMQNFLSPGYLKTIDDSKVNQEVEAIYHETLDGDVIPKSPPKYFSVNGERKDLTGDEYTKFSKVTGQTAFNILNKMVDTEAYQGLDAAGKANAIVNAYDYALAKGKQAVSSYKPSGWIANADAQKVDPTEYIVARAAQDALVDDILMMNSENAHERVAQILDSGVDASDLRSRITSTVKPIYVEMYKSGSTDEVKQLRALLYNLNIGYDMGDFQQWTKGWWQ
jgi:hypothetical protein